MEGKTLGRFEVLEQLGQGGMGVVYLAKDAQLQRNVALKFLTAEALANKTAEKRFFLEARAAAALDHPYICKIFDVGEFEKQPYMAIVNAGQAGQYAIQIDTFS